MQEQWSRGRNGQKETVEFYVEVTGYDHEPTGTVEVSIELLRQMLNDLGYFKEDID